jgi:hypothetical protein
MATLVVIKRNVTLDEFYCMLVNLFDTHALGDLQKERCAEVMRHALRYTGFGEKRKQA